MIIEHYRDQNLSELREKVIEVYDTIYLSRSGFLYRLFDYTNWHPEGEGNYNDTWVLIKLMETFGYHSYFFDTVLYTSEFNEYGSQEKITGDGITFNQAVCNMFVNYYFEYEKRTMNNAKEFSHEQTK